MRPPICCICEHACADGGYPAIDPQSGRDARVCDGCVPAYLADMEYAAEARSTANDSFLNRW